MRARKFETADIQGVASLLRLFREDELSPDYMKGLPEQTIFVERVILTIFADHTFLVEDKGEVVAVILAHKGAMPLTPSANVIEEVVFYVREDYRGTRAGALLFAKWIQYAKKLRDNDEVTAILMHTLVNSPIDMTHHGFSLLQQTYILEE